MRARTKCHLQSAFAIAYCRRRALLIGETPEWETVEHVADAVTEDKPKALVIVSHIPLGASGHGRMFSWLKTFLTEVRVEFIPASEPFWLPRRRPRPIGPVPFPNIEDCHNPLNPLTFHSRTMGLVRAVFNIQHAANAPVHGS
jgi:hypothetical protein